MTTCPKIEKYVNVSTTTNPVTQVAEVAVNNAVLKSVATPAFEQIGSININAPIKINSAKLETITLAGFEKNECTKFILFLACKSKFIRSLYIHLIYLFRIISLTFYVYKQFINFFVKSLIFICFF